MELDLRSYVSLRGHNDISRSEVEAIRQRMRCTAQYLVYVSRQLPPLQYEHLKYTLCSLRLTSV